MIVPLSNSNVLEFLTCKRKFYYSTDLRLAPKQFNSPLTKGIAGHKFLEIWYKTFDKAQISEEFNRIIDHSPNDFTDVATALQLSMSYIDYYYPDYSKYPEVLFVEHPFEVELADDLIFKFKPDLIYKDKVTNQVVLMDHKFVWNFFDDIKINFNPQLVKYISALKAIGLDVDYAVINQIRTRPGTTERYRQEILQPSNDHIMGVWKDHYNTVKLIYDWTELSQEEKDKQAVRIFNPVICQYCPFNLICLSDLKGQDSSFMIDQDFEDNDYIGDDYPAIGTFDRGTVPLKDDNTKRPEPNQDTNIWTTGKRKDLLLGNSSETIDY